MVSFVHVRVQRLDDRLRILLALLDIRPLRICLVAVLAAAAVTAAASG